MRSNRPLTSTDTTSTMLRINETVEARRNGRPRWTLEVEGALRGEWVAELRRSWRRIRDLASGASIRVELADVSYIDAGGKVLLAEMYRDGVEVLARDCLTQAIRDEIVARSKSDRHWRRNRERDRTRK